MFDNIDFLSPHSTPARPRRASGHGEVELIRPSVPKKASWWTLFMARARKPSASHPAPIGSTPPPSVRTETSGSPHPQTRGSRWAALIHSAPPPTATVVAISPDLGERYADTVYNPTWVAEKFGLHIDDLMTTEVAL